MVVCLVLFVSLKGDLRACERRSKKKLAAMERDWDAKIQLLDERWEELSQISGLLVPPTPPRSGLNLTKRSQALQMFRRGETPQDIAAALSIPRNEVELLVKVQALTL
jgi:DNA-binding NarL/FixJ family response regulator